MVTALHNLLPLPAESVLGHPEDLQDRQPLNKILLLPIRVLLRCRARLLLPTTRTR
jgi:hypothetical protein